VHERVCTKPARMFLFHSGDKSFSMCTCAKCGSSSTYSILLFLVTGQQGCPPNGCASIHDYAGWGFPNVSSTGSHSPGKLHIMVYRDPVERLISAFHSKVKCCANTTQPCFDDTRDTFGTQSILKCNHWSPAPQVGERSCLSFREYANALASCHAKGLRRNLNAHFLPQDVACPPKLHAPTLMVPINKTSSLWPALRNFGLHRPPPSLFRPGHSTSQAAKAAYPLEPGAVKQLRAISAPEYKYIASYWRR